MGMLARIAAAIAPPREKAANLSTHEQWFWDYLTGGGKSAAGVAVNANTAMHSPAIFSAVQAIAQDVAKLPCVVQRVDDATDRRDRWRQNPLWSILHDQPYPGLTSYRFRFAMQAQVLLHGNAYAEIFRDSRGRVLGLKPFKPGVVSILRYEKDGTLFYDVRDGARAERLGSDRMFHLRGLTFDGDCGFSAISQLKDSIGLGLAAQDYAARFYANDATPRTMFSRPGHFATDELRNKFRDALVSMLTGENRHKPLIGEDGLEVKQLGMSNEDAQMIDTRKQQRSEAGAAMRTPPHKLGDLEKATFSNIEQQSIEYVQDTLLPHIRNWESELTLALVPETERDVTEIQIVVAGLLRGDMKTQGEYFAKALGSGGSPAWMTPNEVRKLVDLNPIEGGDDLPKPATNAGPAATEDTNDEDETDDAGELPSGGEASRPRRLSLRALPGPSLVAS